MSAVKLNQSKYIGESEEREKSNEDLKIKTGKLSKRGKNSGDQVVIGVSFGSDYRRDWCEFSRPITERSKSKPIQSGRITFDNQLKTS